MGAIPKRHFSGWTASLTLPQNNVSRIAPMCEAAFDEESFCAIRGDSSE